jgi:Anti-sigma-K factor rskA
VLRRRLVAAGGVVAAILVAVLLWPVTAADDDVDGGGGTQRAPASPQPASSAKTPAGVAVIALQNRRRQVVVQAANLQPTQEGQAYEVWLYNSPQHAKSMGAQVTNAKGQYRGAGRLPGDYARYRFVDVSREPIDNNRAHSGQSVLRGKLPRLKSVPRKLKRRQPVSLGQVVLLPPEG